MRYSLGPYDIENLSNLGCKNKLSVSVQLQDALNEITIRQMPKFSRTKKKNKV